MKDVQARFKPPFVRVFRYPARVAIVGVLADSRDEDLGATEIATQADVAPSTFHDHRETLVELGFVERDDDGPTPVYSLADTDVARRLLELDDALETTLDEVESEYEETVEEFIE